MAAAQSKLQAVPTTGSTSASAVLDAAVHDTKILFAPVFPMLPDMSNGRLPHPDSALARAEPWFGWLADVTATYLFKRTLYIWKRKRAGATSTGQTVFPWETTPLSFSDWQGWKVASIGLGTDGKMTFDAHQVQRLFDMWSHHGLQKPWLLGGSIPTANHMGESSGLKTRMRSTLTGIQQRGRGSHRPRCARWGGPFRLAGTRGGCRG